MRLDPDPRLDQFIKTTPFLSTHKIGITIMGPPQHEGFHTSLTQCLLKPSSQTSPSLKPTLRKFITPHLVLLSVLRAHCCFWKSSLLCVILSYVPYCFKVSFLHQVCGRVICSRNYAVKDISFGVGARATMLQGVNEVAEAVKVTMGPKVVELLLVCCFFCLPLFY
ncbi:uncharacterized protein LOC120004632 [Tripterygium wilfordii]|uniref:uncharacterized protein LOC120004632 n=1 Tax=Tripterygium wilfordii TaxID=458696 RepID=UPI0018F84F21|nr:uncharacterized protein LOC120004632 [Tripterygium wilfordii]